MWNIQIRENQKKAKFQEIKNIHFCAARKDKWAFNMFSGKKENKFNLIYFSAEVSYFKSKVSIMCSVICNNNSVLYVDTCQTVAKIES